MRRSPDALSGRLPPRSHGISPYVRPSDRSLAATQVSLNQGWPSSRRTSCCPTIPVAPRIPTSQPCVIALDLSTDPRFRRPFARPTQATKPSQIKTRRLAVQFGGLLWSLCALVCYGPATAPPPMLVIRIAIIRIAAAGVVWSRAGI